MLMVVRRLHVCALWGRAVLLQRQSGSGEVPGGGTSPRGLAGLRRGLKWLEKAGGVRGGARHA